MRFFQHRTIILSILIIILFSGAGYLLFTKVFNNQPIVCTMEAKICPDGTSVGRVEPNCEFADCPVAYGWQTYADPANNLEFQYPQTLTAQYIFIVSWPPQIKISQDPFNCDETPTESSLPNRVSQRLVDDRVYCVKAESEDATGSIYTTYNYTGQLDDKSVTLTFTLRFPQCLNYNDPKQTECQNEREAFDLDGVMDRIFQSLKFDSTLGLAAWENLKSAVENCQVKSLMQTHARRVSVELKSGGELAAIEPIIDDIIKAAVAVQKKCGQNQMATE